MTARYVVMSVAEARASGRRAAGMVSRVAAERVCRLANAGKATIGAWTTGPDDTCAIVDAWTAADGSPLPALCECVGERVRTQGDRARCGRCGRQFAVIVTDTAADGRDAPAGERRPSGAWRSGVSGYELWVGHLRLRAGALAWEVEAVRTRGLARWCDTLASGVVAGGPDAAMLAAESAAEALLVAALEELRGGRK